MVDTRDAGVSSGCMHWISGGIVRYKCWYIEKIEENLIMNVMMKLNVLFLFVMKDIIGVLH